jgi:hypothetical protein
MIATPSSRVKLFTVSPDTFNNTEELQHAIDTIISIEKETALRNIPEISIISYRGAFGEICISIRYEDTVLIDIDIGRYDVSLWASIYYILKAPWHVKTRVLELLTKISKLLQTPYRDTIEILTNWLKQKTAE